MKDKDSKNTWSAGHNLNERANSYQKIASSAIANARKISKEKGVPLAFIENKKICYELPDGTITSKKPWAK